MFSHYLQITVTDNKKAKEADLASDVLQQIHHFHSQKLGQLAVAFPEMNAQQHSIGSVVRIFGDLTHLETFFNMKGVSLLIGHKFYRFSLPAKVPENIESFQSYIRDRHREKKTLAGQVRDEERTIRRAMDGKVTQVKNSDDLQQYRAHLCEARRELKTQPAVMIKMSSATNGRAFHLNIESIKGAPSQTNFISSYGLSSRKHPFALPIF